MNRGRRILLIGDATVDITIRVPPDSQQATSRALEPKLFGGGTAANTAVALARLGVSASILASIGDDVLGRFVAEDLACAGVDTTWLRTEEDALTPPVLVIVDPDGERTAVGLSSRKRYVSRLSPDLIQPHTFESVSWVHTTGVDFDDSRARQAVLRGMELAAAADIPVSIDLNLRNGIVDGELTSDFRRGLEQAMEHADVLFGSAQEEFVYLADGDSPEMLARQLADGRRTVVARLGSDGALAVSRDQIIHSAGLDVTVVDTLGAGDAFNGGFIAARTEGHSLQNALHWGNAVAGLTITERGARSVPCREEVERLLGAE